MTPRVNRLACGVAVACVPFCVLLAGTGSDATQASFRATPTNVSYELMTCAVAAAVLVAVLVEHRLLPRLQTTALLKLNAAAPLAPLMVFMVLWSGVQAVLHAVNDIWGTAALWTAAFLLAGFRSEQEACEMRLRCLKWKDVSLGVDRACTSHAVRAILLVFACGLWVPVLMPWSGPPEEFVRWHAFSPDGELLWRGTFACFSVCNILTAVDPTGIGAGYTVFMAAQGLLHGSVMLIDNRLAAAHDGANGNPQHAWGEIPFFLFLGMMLSLLLAARLRSPPRTSVENLQLTSSAA